MQLGDLGADVIKIESPAQAIRCAAMPPFVNGEGAPFMMWNRNKRGIVSTSRRADRERCSGWSTSADMVIENFRPGVIIGSASAGRRCRAQSPAGLGRDLGFRPDRPLCDRGGFDS